jgi:predicted nuclease of predicted toxin-antitoxin system
LDFGAILAATGGTGPSVVQLRAGDTSPEANGRAMVGALAQCEQDLAVGALLTVDVARVRLTILPLARHDG